MAAATNLYIFSSETRQPIGSYTCPDGAISGLQFSPNANLLGFTSLDGSFHRWKEPIPSEFPDPYTSEAAQAKKLDKLLDDEFPDDDDIEERGEDIGDEDILGMTIGSLMTTGILEDMVDMTTRRSGERGGQRLVSIFTFEGLGQG